VAPSVIGLDVVPDQPPPAPSNDPRRTTGATQRDAGRHRAPAIQCGGEAAGAVLSETDDKQVRHVPLSRQDEHHNGSRAGILFTTGTATHLESNGDPRDRQVATVIRQSIADPDLYRRREGEQYQVVLLDRESGFVLPAAIEHPSGAAWLRGQRYTRSDALKTRPATTDELAAAGG
jgi:hypothetical protein